jgi:Ca2+-binding EF-hand superfamily protein
MRFQHHRGGRRAVRAATAALLPPVWLFVAMTFGTAVAQQADAGLEPGLYERFAFDAADTDGDGLVSEAELARDAAAGFSGLDSDGSGTLTPEELGPHEPERFERVDADGDGALSFSEVMTHKTRALEEGDENGDGRLSFDEMVQSVTTELGGQQ